MPDYKTMYFELFNKVSDAVNILQIAQQEGENSFIEGEDAKIVLIDNTDNDKKK